MYNREPRIEPKIRKKKPLPGQTWVHASGGIARGVVRERHFVFAWLLVPLIEASDSSLMDPAFDGTQSVSFNRGALAVAQLVGHDSSSTDRLVIHRLVIHRLDDVLFVQHRMPLPVAGL